MADMNRENPETQGTTGNRVSMTRGSPGVQESEDAGMQQMSRMIREEREEGDPEMQMREEDLHARQQNLGGGTQTGARTRTETGTQMDTGTQTGMEGETGDVAYIIYIQECAICDRERGMSDRERGMADRERAMFDRECAMTERERSSVWGGEREGESSAGGMTRGQSRTGGQSESSRTGANR